MEPQTTVPIEQNEPPAGEGSGGAGKAFALLLMLGAPVIWVVAFVRLSIMCSPGPQHPAYGVCDSGALGLYMQGCPLVGLSVLLGLIILAVSSRGK